MKAFTEFIVKNSFLVLIFIFTCLLLISSPSFLLDINNYLICVILSLFLFIVSRILLSSNSFEKRYLTILHDISIALAYSLIFYGSIKYKKSEVHRKKVNYFKISTLETMDKQFIDDSTFYELKYFGDDFSLEFNSKQKNDIKNKYGIKYIYVIKKTPILKYYNNRLNPYLESKYGKKIEDIIK